MRMQNGAVSDDQRRVGATGYIEAEEILEVQVIRDL
jgi:hypothetical protein